MRYTLLISVFIFLLTLSQNNVFAWDVLFEYPTRFYIVNDTSEIIIDNAISKNLTFYFKLDNGDDNVLNLTFYLPEVISFVGTNMTSVDNTLFDVDPSNSSIAQWHPNISAGASNLLLSTNSYSYFTAELNPSTTLTESEKIFTFKMSIHWTNGSYTNKTYFLVFDDLAPRIVNYSFFNSTTIYNKTNEPKLNVSLYDILWSRSYLAIVFKNSTKYNYYPENITYYVYLQQQRNSENFTMNIPSKRYVLYDKNYKKVTNALIMDMNTTPTGLLLIGNISNPTTHEYFIGGILYNKSDPDRVLYVYDFKKHIMMNDSGWYLLNGSLIQKIDNYYDYWNINLSIGFVNKSGWYIGITKKLYNLSYVIENMTLKSKVFIDGNYSIYGEFWDVFRKTSKEKIFEFINSPYIENISVDLKISNGTRYLAYNNDISFEVSDPDSPNITCVISINDSSSNVALSSFSNKIEGNYSFAIDFSLYTGYRVLNLTCYDDFKHYASDYALIKIEDIPELDLKFINITPEGYGKGDILKIYYNITNSGSAQATNINVTFKVCSDSACNDVMLLNYTTLTSLSTGTYEVKWFNYSLKDTITKYFKIDAYANEKDFNYSNQNISGVISPTLKVDVNISGDLSNLIPGSNITLFINVKHYDNTPITDLTNQNFTLYDYWHYSNKYSNYDAKFYLLNDFGNGTYKFAYELPNMTSSRYYEFGIHKIKIEILTSKYKKLNTTEKTYDIKAPFVELYFSNVPSSMDVGDTVTAYIEVKNIGDITINAVKIVLKTSSSSKLTFNGASSYTCYIDAISLGGTKSCSFTLKAEDSGSVDLFVSSSLSDTYFNVSDSNYAHDIYFYTYPQKTISINEAQQQQETTTQETTTSTTDTSTTTDNNADTSQSTTTTEPNNKVSNIEIEISQQKYEFLINESKTIEVKVKNTGNGSASSLKLELEYDKKNLDVVYDFDKTSLDPGEEYTFNLNVSSPTKRVGEYVIAITISYDDNKTAESSVTIVLLPTEEKKKEIESMLETMKSEIKNLDVPESMKTVYDQTKKYIEDAENKIKEGDYVSAYTLLEKAQKNINVIKMSSSSESSSMWGIWIIVGIIILGIMGGIAYYLLTPPTSTYHPEKGYSFNPKIYEEQRANYIKKLKESLQRKLS